MPWLSFSDFRTAPSLWREAAWIPTIDISKIFSEVGRRLAA